MLTTCHGPVVIDARARVAYRLLITIFPQNGGPRRNIVIMFGINKLEWCGYPKVKQEVKVI